MTLQEIEHALQENKKAMKQVTEEYEIMKRRLGIEQDEWVRRKELVLNGIDVDTILKAEKLIEIRYNTEQDFDDWPVQAFIMHLSDLNSHRVYEEYALVKNYASFYHQHEWCMYGYSPTYGNVVCRVGLRNHTKLLLTDEIDTCLFYLNWMLNPEKRRLIHND
jgi:hypothetical protein